MQSKFLIVLALTGLPFSDSKSPLDPEATSSSDQREYGASVEVGNGRARTYIVVDLASGNPVEVGVVLDEAALEGLPATGDQDKACSSYTLHASPFTPHAVLIQPYPTRTHSDTLRSTSARTRS